MSFDDGAHSSGDAGGAAAREIVELTPERRERVLRYLDAVDIAVSGQGGSNPTFRFANVLVDGFGLTIAQARPFMLIYSAKCKPPWSMEEIEHKLADALKAKGKQPRGYLWGKELEAGDDGEGDGTPLPWVPQETLDIAKDIDKPIVFTQGQANGEALLRAGAFPIGLHRRLKLRTELASFEWEYRQVFLCFDQKGKKDRRLEIRHGFFCGWLARRFSNWRAGRQRTATGRTFSKRSTTAISTRSRTAAQDNRSRQARGAGGQGCPKAQASQRCFDWRFPRVKERRSSGKGRRI